MLDALDALYALHEEGSTSSAAARLRLTQSTISKRLAALERTLGRPVHEAEGRGCRLTAYGLDLVARTAPLVAELRAQLAADPETDVGLISIACSESIFASWGAGLLARVERRMRRAGLANARFEFHAHRSPVAIERVRSGLSHVALVAGDGRRDADLVMRVVEHEEMVVVPAKLERGKLGKLDEIGVWAIEETSMTWRSIRSRIAAMRERAAPALRIEGRLESFSALVQFATAGFGHALVPRGIAIAFGVPTRSLVRFRDGTEPQLRRRISYVTRKTTAKLDRAKRFEAALVEILRAADL